MENTENITNEKSLVSKILWIVIAGVIGIALTSVGTGSYYQGQTSTRLTHIENDIDDLNEEKLDSKVMLEYIQASKEVTITNMKLLDKHESYSSHEIDIMRQRLIILETRVRDIEIKFIPNALRSQNKSANIKYSNILNWTWEQGEWDLFSEIMSIPFVDEVKVDTTLGGSSSRNPIGLF